MANYVQLRRVVTQSATPYISIGNLPTSGYSHLKIVTSFRCSTSNSANWALIQYNDLPDTYVNLRHIIGDASSAASQAYNSGRVFTTNTSMTSDTFAVSEFVIYNYRDTTRYKIVGSQSAQETNTTTPRPSTSISAQLINTNNPIDSIKFSIDGGGSFAPYSSVSIYGLRAETDTPVTAPKAYGGDFIGTDGYYWYHTFFNTGVFTPKTDLSCEHLVIAGGGGGGRGANEGYGGGGGGAGGLRYGTTNLSANLPYTATIGSGGTGGSGNYSSNQTNGTNSSLVGGGISFSSTGGGAGATVFGNGNSGGSGGGAGGHYGGTGGTGGAGNAGSYSPVEGYAGGNGQSGSPAQAGAGGGAGGVGEAGGTGSKVGGPGLSTYINWAFATGTGVSGYYAGGGGGSGGGSGGAGGAGGGGAGSYGGTGASGVANTGGGGGGCANGSAGGAGGSGIVIVRYAV